EKIGAPPIGGAPVKPIGDATWCPCPQLETGSKVVNYNTSEYHKIFPMAIL
ncbi:Hypothetical predicted protein, partial [Olea europaea subsp. europaea]